MLLYQTLSVNQSFPNIHDIPGLPSALTTCTKCISSVRDKQTGLWEHFDAMELATPDAFARDPALVWGWYEWRRAAVARAEPNPAHHAIAAMATHVPQFTLITQNVDDLHERAGSRNVLHLHGELSRPYCENSRQPYVYPTEIPQLPVGGKRLRQDVATDEVRKATWVSAAYTR